MPQAAVMNALLLCNSCRTNEASVTSPGGYCRRCEMDARRASERRVALVNDGENKPTWTGTLEDFLDANSETLDDDDVAALLSLELGCSVQFGGGAAPLSSIWRVE